VVVKVEEDAQKVGGALRPHYIVTDIFANAPAQKAHAFYCARGDAENRVPTQRVGEGVQAGAKSG
jgi:hypothetical protein